MYAPPTIVYIWAGRRFKEARLKYYGIMFIAMGVITGLGANYLGLWIAGRSGKSADGESAVDVAYLIIGLGVLLVIIHTIARFWSKKGKRHHPHAIRKS